MKRFPLGLLMGLSVVLVATISCSFGSQGEDPSVIEPVNNSVESASTALPPTEVPDSTATPIPPTDTEVPSPTTPPLTDTPFIIVVFSPTPDVFNTKINVFLPRLSGTFKVPADTDLTLSDTGTDGKKNTCKITKSDFKLEVEIPNGKSSTAFQLKSGEYTLNCGVLNVNATIISKTR